ncbi:hypothetical protein NRB56_67190 [Nocardia sp. RB56]|uniref:MFS transporter n=1 Tax=Nocardia aurantia TaxID=2585199 RepID=A0A7K0DZM4_9NOCA|nr:hypothetical protein [Nocardia aurantia]
MRDHGDRHAFGQQLGRAVQSQPGAPLRAVPEQHIALAAAVAAGAAVNIPFAVLVKLGQDYLPGRPGTASSVTLGLAVSAGGLFVPVLGVVADHQGPQAVLTVLCIVPLAAVVLGFLLPAHD